MQNSIVATVTKWVVAFLIIFLLLMILILSFMYKKQSASASTPAYGSR